jgi:ATP adenylyltransferase/5',5'''-P-1,P-4-tetraphosphate phosphorylase II
MFKCSGIVGNHKVIFWAIEGLTSVYIDHYNPLLVSGLRRELQVSWRLVALSLWNNGVDTQAGKQYHKRRSLIPMPRLTDVDALCLGIDALATMSATEIVSGVLTTEG